MFELKKILQNNSAINENQNEIWRMATQIICERNLEFIWH